MKRRIITSLALMSMFLMLISTTVFANENDTFSLNTEHTAVMTGDTVVVTLSNTGSSAGVEGVLEYDPDVLIYKSVSFVDSIATKNSDYRSIRTYDSGQIRFSIVGDSENGTTGSWASFTFEVKAGFGGNTQVSLANLQAADTSATLQTVVSGEPVEISVTPSAIMDASLSLGESITVNYYATLSESNQDAQMKFTMNEKEVTVDGTLVSGNEYKFAFEGVSPQCMTDTIAAQLIDGTEVLDTYDSYSVRAYCDSLLASDATTLGMSAEKYDAMKTLVADLLEYGAMAQTYRGYKTDSLADKDITDQSKFVELTEEWKAAPTNSGTNVKITAGGVWFANVNKLYLKFTTTDINNTTLVFDGVTYTSEHFELVSDDTYIFYSDAISPSEFGVGKTAQFKYGETVEATITYCVNNYVYSKQNQNTDMGNLAKALYNYGISAVAYMDAQ